MILVRCFFRSVHLVHKIRTRYQVEYVPGTRYIKYVPGTRCSITRSRHAAYLSVSIATKRTTGTRKGRRDEETSQGYARYPRRRRAEAGQTEHSIDLLLIE